MNEKNYTNQVLDRLKIALDLRPNTKDAELADKLGISKSTLSTWRQRDSTPYELCVKVSKEYQVDLTWLLTGEGNMYRHPTELGLDKQAQKIIETFNALTEAQKSEFSAFIEDKKRLNDLEKQLSQLTARLSA